MKQKDAYLPFVMECSFSCNAGHYTEGSETAKKSQSESWLVPQAAHLRQD